MTFEERTGHAIRVPGREEVLIHAGSETFLMIRRREAWPFALLWPIARRLPPSDGFADWVAARVTDPTEAQCRQSTYTEIVSNGAEAIRIDGRDVYGSTARFAVRLAGLLVAGEAHAAGVLPCGAALYRRASGGIAQRSMTDAHAEALHFAWPCSGCELKSIRGVSELRTNLLLAELPDKAVDDVVVEIHRLVQDYGR